MGSDLFDYPTGGGVAVPESPLLAEASPVDWDVVRRHGELRGSVALTELHGD
jgi:hypothetical protein